jgi:hypothetical protein
VVYYGGSLTAINAVLAIIADGGQAIVVIYIEGVEINYFLHYFIDSAKTLRLRPRRGSRGCGIFVHQTHAVGGGNGSIMVGMFVCLCLASKKPSEREVFVPPRMDLGVKLLTMIYMKPSQRALARPLRKRGYLRQIG